MNQPSKIVQFGLAIIAILFTVGLVYASDEGVYLQSAVGAVSIDDFPGSIPIDDESTAFQFGVGFDFGNNIALEGGYLNWGDFDGASSNGQAKGEVDGGTVSALFTLPLTDNLSATARAGVFFWESQLRTPDFAFKADGDDVFYGVGLRTKLSNNLGLTGEWQRYEFGDDTADIIFVGASYKF